MALLRAFKALRPIQKLASKVAALPYDVISSEEARRKVVKNPYSFLHVDKAEIDLPRDIDLYDEKVYIKAGENLKNMIKNGTLIKDEEANLYIYRQIMDSHIQTGLVGCVSIDDYIDGNIKKHEDTREDKEEDRINHVRYCNANTGPIFLAYKEKADISVIIEKWTMKHKPVYDFIASDGIKHTLWVIDDSETIGLLTEHFKSIDSLYIADGHHRTASAVEVGKMKRAENPDYSGDEEFNFFLGVVFPHSDLKIMDYNRVVKDLNNHTIEDFLNKVGHSFDIEIYEESEGYKPIKKHDFGMFLGNKWYKLSLKEDFYDADSDNLVENLDVSILQNKILSPILGIKDPRNDSRIDFVGGIRGLVELEKKVKEGAAVAFSMYPTTIDDIMSIADEDRTMPPKSTWFEPKLRSGLFIHELD